MDLYGSVLLLALGFAVGISGALMPGPLLVYTINESLRRGKWTGILVITGHAIVEVFIFILLALGLNELMTSQSFIKTVSILGGIAMILLAYSSLKNLKKELKFDTKPVSHNAIVGGIIFTAFNPGFPLWWATAGTTLLMEGFRRMGFTGMLLVFLGHWGADWGWFTFISMLTSKSSRMLFERGWYKKMRILLSMLLLAIGVYFLAGGF